MAIWSRLESRMQPERIFCHRSVIGVVAGISKLAEDARFTQASSTMPAAAEKNVWLWREFFSDPSQWWDNRLRKVNSRYPDFKHKKRKEALWIDSWMNPAWVQAELDAMPQKSAEVEVLESRKPSRLDVDVRRMSRDGNLKEALLALDGLCDWGIRASTNSYVCILQECSRRKALAEGKHVHAQIVKSGLELSCILGRSLVRMYASCRCTAEARQVFEKMREADLFAVTALLKGYLENGEGREALQLFREVRSRGVRPDKFVYAIIVNACASLADLSEGRQVHAEMVNSGVEADIWLSNSLVDMYAKCGSIECANDVFEKMPQKDVVSWNMVIGVHVQHGLATQALQLFKTMLREGWSPNLFTFICAANACASVGDLAEGKLVHSLAMEAGQDQHLAFNNALVDMYAKCKSLQDAHEVFDRMREKDTVSWNALIQGYSQHGFLEQAFSLFKEMQCMGVKPNVITFIHMLKACSSAAVLEQIKCLHGFVIESGLESEVFIGNSLLDMYAKSGSLLDARELFQQMPARNVVSWTTMITAYAHAGLGEEALGLFEQMQLEGIRPNRVTYICALKACASARARDKGRSLHQDIIDSAVDSDVMLETALVDMYGKCGSVDEARVVFVNMRGRNVVAWNAMIACCAQNGHGEEALKLFEQMQREDFDPDVITFVSVLNACSGIGALEVGQMVHSSVVRQGHKLDHIVGNALVDMYGQCGSLENARQVFHGMSVRDVISWNALIKGYVHHGQPALALNLLKEMHGQGVQPDLATYLSLVNGCAGLGALDKGRGIHADICISGLEHEVLIGNALIDMYAKCGSIEDARKVFDRMSKRDMISWSSMVSGYSQHGFGNQSLHLFAEMLRNGIPADHITFVGVLSACSRIGLVETGLEYFNSMSRDHGISPTDAHYSCVVDLYSRAGRLDEAVDLIKSMLQPPSTALWTSVLAGCRLHGNVALAEEAAAEILLMEPKNSSAFVLLANTYAAAGRPDDEAKLRKLMKETGVKKQPGYSWISLNNEVNFFAVEDKSHSQADQIYAKLDSLSRQMKIDSF